MSLYRGKAKMGGDRIQYGSGTSRNSRHVHRRNRQEQ